MQRLNVHLHTQRNPPYVLNLDPAVLNLPYEANIDIRDSINYKEVMKQYISTFSGVTVDMVLVQMEP
jgi:hypothetical protein